MIYRLLLPIWYELYLSIKENTIQIQKYWRKLWETNYDFVFNKSTLLFLSNKTDGTFEELTDKNKFKYYI